MSAAELHTMLRADARRWPDHTDYWRHGPTLDVCTVPATLRTVNAGWAALYTAGRSWIVADAVAGPLHAF